MSPQGSVRVAPDDVFLKLDLAGTLKRAISSADLGGGNNESDRIPIRAILLEQDFVVFVSGDERATELVIDLEEETNKQVMRKSVDEIEQGMAVLVRSEGGGDFVVDAADRILRTDADKLREAQRAWKRLLQIKVSECGMTHTIELLRSAGSTIASEQNVQNWMSFRSIRTQNQSDFNAIFSVIGAPEKAQKAWEMMGRILSAHRRAGALIREQLLSEVKAADLTSLERDGKQEFALPGDVGGGAIIAHRVVSVSPEPIEMHPSALHQVIEPDLLSWLN